MNTRQTAWIAIATPTAAALGFAGGGPYGRQCLIAETAAQRTASGNRGVASPPYGSQPPPPLRHAREDGHPGYTVLELGQDPGIARQRARLPRQAQAQASEILPRLREFGVWASAKADAVTCSAGIHSGGDIQ